VLRCQAANYKECERADDATSSDSSSQVPSTPAVATTSHAVTRGDYPADSIRLNESGEVTVTYVINEMGSVTTCSVVLSSGKGRLDNAACVMVKGAGNTGPRPGRCPNRPIHPQDRLSRQNEEFHLPQRGEVDAGGSGGGGEAATLAL
jgi:TonB family protein